MTAKLSGRHVVARMATPSSLRLAGAPQVSGQLGTGPCVHMERCSIGKQALALQALRLCFLAKQD